MTRARDLASGSGIEAGEVLPHIIPDVLYPAVAGKLLDGSTSHSGAYGTAQSDGRSYFYTDIKGSREISDPRIGSYFGSQRHKFKSIQLLEQETATHGSDVYSIDGREWCRAFSLGEAVAMENAGAGHYLNLSTHFAVEIVGYLNQLNMICLTWTDQGSTHKTYLDGSLQSATWSTDVSAGTPLSGRFVDAGSLINISFDSAVSLGIHTIRIEPPNSSTKIGYTYGCELIAQDTTSTANKSKIQIPAQNVVSYGKKFAIPTTAQHYDPFNGFTNETDNHNTYIDYATSLGTDGWKNGSNYYRPYNGGRVVKWVDSSGTIKTSVNMMPPNARSIGNSSSLTNATAKANASIANNTFYPTMEAGAIDHSQAEVAKRLHIREFGNGSANGNASYKDITTLHGDNVGRAYVMDDGLTSLSFKGGGGGDDALNQGFWQLGYGENNVSGYLTFIGTGITWGRNNTASSYTNASAPDIKVQNLPYGTHILKFTRVGEPGLDVWIDGIQILDDNSYNPFFDADGISIHQPKNPPIPEDAVVIADYMLMADFVSLGASNNNDKRSHISKGVRRISASRDVFYDDSTWTLAQNVLSPSGFGHEAASSDQTAKAKITFFGDKVVWFSNDPVTRFVDGTCTFSTGTKGTTVDISSTNDASIGAREFGITDGPVSTTFTGDSTGASNSYGTKNLVNALDLHTPIHTSSHYQTLETPFLHELVGGDRNMEQTNLVVTPDGKSWDEVTRDVSYIGNMVVNTTTDTETTWSTSVKFDEWRGMTNLYMPLLNKDFAIAYDRMICLVDGQYTITVTTRATGAGENSAISINGQDIINANTPTDNQNFELSTSLPLKRGDYVMYKGSFGTSNNYHRFIITRDS